MAKPVSEISFPFEEAPKWLDKIVFSSPNPAIIKIELVRESGTLLADTTIEVEHLQRMIAFLTSS